jgi:hypothetical protein
VPHRPGVESLQGGIARSIGSRSRQIGLSFQQAQDIVHIELWIRW